MKYRGNHRRGCKCRHRRADHALWKFSCVKYCSCERFVEAERQVHTLPVGLMGAPNLYRMTTNTIAFQTAMRRLELAVKQNIPTWEKLTEELTTDLPFGGGMTMEEATERLSYLKLPIVDDDTKIEFAGSLEAREISTGYTITEILADEAVVLGHVSDGKQTKPVIGYQKPKIQLEVSMGNWSNKQKNKMIEMVDGVER